jgi:hypothetical protein
MSDKELIKIHQKQDIKIGATFFALKSQSQKGHVYVYVYIYSNKFTKKVRYTSRLTHSAKLIFKAPIMRIIIDP